MSRTDDAIASIKRMIVSGELRPGDRLPREPDLAKRLDLSRNTLREAVRALSLIRVLDVRRGDGTYVTDLDPTTLLETFAFLVDLHRTDNVLHFFHIRRLLEPEATAIAATAMSDDDAAGLQSHLDAVGDNPDVDDLVANDVVFHRRIAEAAGNPVLTALLDSLTGVTQRARLWRGFAEAGAVERTLTEHRAIANHEPELARATAITHVIGLEMFLRRALHTR
jgi:GntR family transcriptional regulator, transcriptional repressor for pyruvate dehydrogenase complex